MKWILIVLGILMTLIGGVWILQGTHILTQGVMAGDMKWTYIGGIVAIVGIVLLVIGAMRKKTARTA
jgi:hypothetical protein